MARKRALAWTTAAAIIRSIKVVPLFAVLIRTMKKLYSKCGHARFPWWSPVSIWEQCEWAITVRSTIR